MIPVVLRWLCVLLSLSTVAVAVPANAEWRRATTDRFVIYSEGSEGDLRERVRMLHRFDRLIRAPFGLDDAPPARPLTVLLVTGRDGKEAIYPAVPEGIGGWYSATEHDVYAALDRRVGPGTLLHEYVHHVMLQNFPAATPAWFTEGIAEFYKTARIDDKETRVGFRDDNRIVALNRLPWVPMDRLLTRRALSGDRAQTAAFYAQAWLLTHYLMSDPDRRQTMVAYLDAVAKGTPPLEAVQATLGMTPDELEQALRRYLRGQIPYATYPTPATADPVMTIETLPPSADELFSLSVRLNYAQRGDDGPRVFARVKAAAERWPEDRLARMTLAKAEYAWGTPEAAEAALTRLLETEPNDVEALRWMARLRQRAAAQAQASGENDARDTLNGQARAYLARALNAEPDDYRIYLALGRSRRGASGYPNENDLRTWASAVELAPQVAAVRGEAAQAFARAGQVDTAVALLLPLANDPHGGALAARARRELQALRPDGEAPDQPEVIEPETDDQTPALPPATD